jgi:hypothetical protein
MTPAFADKVLSLVESLVQRYISPIEFEMAIPRARVAIDRIRFAISITEQSANEPEQLREAAFQLLDPTGPARRGGASFHRRFQSVFPAPHLRKGRSTRERLRRQSWRGEEAQVIEVSVLVVATRIA